MIQSIEEGRKEDGNRSIADKILKRLHELEKTVEHNQGRWAWELLQNAKDSISEFEDRTVDIQIELTDSTLEFRHTGLHFTEKDIRGLINQISSKEIEDGQTTKNTGRFGTGFLTTHMLSKEIKIKGVVKTDDNEFYRFQFPLNREGKTTTQLIPKIESAWQEFHKSAETIQKNYNQDDFNTSFSYVLSSKEQKQIAEKGIEEFELLIPFVLTFITKIQKVEIIDKTKNTYVIYENSDNLIDDLIVPISRQENGVLSKVYILTSTLNNVSIAAALKKNENGYAVQDLKSVPKIFCDFPLIGTENFHFPVIVNSFEFNPLTERDGIWLKGTGDSEVLKNQQNLEHAVTLFSDVIAKIENRKFYSLYNFADTQIPDVNDKYFDKVWYKNNIQKQLRAIIFNAKLVEIENDANIKYTLKDLWFPLSSYSDVEKFKLWHVIFDLMPTLVSRKDHLIFWINKSWEEWNKLTFDIVAATIAKKENILTLSKNLRLSEEKTYVWLNDFCTFILINETNQILFDKYGITPNQNGILKKRSEVNLDEIENPLLIKILKLLGDDWQEKLLNRKVKYGKYFSKTREDIAAKIAEKFRGQIVYNQHTNEAIRLLSEWFENNSEEGKKLFSELYKKRAELFMNTIIDKDSLYEVMRSKTALSDLSKAAKALEENPHFLSDLETAKEFSVLLKEYNINNSSELEKILQGAKHELNEIKKMHITEDVLASLGITSLEELDEALANKNFASLFHVSKPSVQMFIFAQTKINRAKDNIINHLKGLQHYDCSEMEELASTVIGGIKKDGLALHVVIRPSDNGQVIVYYSSEKDTLDYANAELWIDNGIVTPQLLTLGKILKNTGINKIPV